jgi:transcriptional regulator with XRE-family HTH domain
MTVSCDIVSGRVSVPGQQKGENVGMAVSRIGTALRSARERAGWSREALAYHSGVSWSAIAQIESGRRQDIRLSSLSALADALQISVDHLVGSKAAVSPSPLGHRVLIYESDDEFVTPVARFLAEGIERSEGVLAVTTNRHIDLLHDALGDGARQVEFKDTADWYQTPTDAVDLYRSFVNERYESGAQWVRIVGDPVWAGTTTEVNAWTRYESLVNLFFASSPATILCTYDARTLPTKILTDARRTHPQITHAGEADTSPDYRPPEDFLLTPNRARRGET